VIWLQPGWIDFVAWATAGIRRVRLGPERRVIAERWPLPATTAADIEAGPYESCSRAAMHGVRRRTRPLSVRERHG